MSLLLPKLPNLRKYCYSTRLGNNRIISACSYKKYSLSKGHFQDASIGVLFCTGVKLEFDSPFDCDTCVILDRPGNLQDIKKPVGSEPFHETIPDPNLGVCLWCAGCTSMGMGCNRQRIRPK